MKEIKQVKKMLKQRNEWQNYKDTFKHKQIRFALSKISLTFNHLLKPSELLKIELLALKAEKNSEMFKEAFKEISKVVDYKANWDALGKFMWYAFQTSTYFNDKKKGVENIYDSELHVEINAKKRAHYMTWMHSVDTTDDYFNDKIIKVLNQLY